MSEYLSYIATDSIPALLAASIPINESSNIRHSSFLLIHLLFLFSYKRIREPFFYNKKIAHLSKDEYNNILLALKKYYTFDN